MTHCTDVLNLPISFEIEYRPFRLIGCLQDDAPCTMSKETFYSNKLGKEKFENTMTSIRKWGSEKDISLYVLTITRGNATLDSLFLKQHLERRHGTIYTCSPFVPESVPTRRTTVPNTIPQCYLQGFVSRRERYLQYWGIGRVSRGGRYDDKGWSACDCVVSRWSSDWTSIPLSLQAVAFLKSDELKEEVHKMCEDARAKGITGIPMTVIDRKWSVNGCQSAEVFIQVRWRWLFSHHFLLVIFCVTVPYHLVAQHSPLFPRFSRNWQIVVSTQHPLLLADPWWRLLRSHANSQLLTPSPLHSYSAWLRTFDDSSCHIYNF